MTGLWDVVNDLTRFRRTSRQNYRVTIFGSARLQVGSAAYEGVKKLALAEISMAARVKQAVTDLRGNGKTMFSA